MRAWRVPTPSAPPCVRGTWWRSRCGTTGTAFRPDVLPRVFEPHFSTRTSGSGLGLAISLQLIEGWGGTIALDSQEGEGTVVRITLRPA